MSKGNRCVYTAHFSKPCTNTGDLLSCEKHGQRLVKKQIPILQALQILKIPILAKMFWPKWHVTNLISTTWQWKRFNTFQSEVFNCLSSRFILVCITDFIYRKAQYEYRLNIMCLYTLAFCSDDVNSFRPKQYWNTLCYHDLAFSIFLRLS